MGSVIVDSCEIGWLLAIIVSPGNQSGTPTFVDMPEAVYSGSGLGNSYEKIWASCPFSTIRVIHDAFRWPMSDDDVDSALDGELVSSFWMVLKSPCA